MTNDQREYVVKSVHEFCLSSSAIFARKLTASSSSQVTKSLTAKNTSSVPRHVARRKIIITGGCGFIGHHVVEHFSRTTDCDLVVIDKLSYASLGYDRLRDTGVMDRVQVFATDLVNGIPEGA